MSLVEFLVFLSGPGINAAIGVALSFVVEWFPQWPDVGSRVKRLVLLALSLLIPVLATMGLSLLGAVDPALPDTWWNALLAGGTAFSASQLAYLRMVPPTATRSNP